MAMNGEKISINIIKPSSPTPTSLKTHQLSFLDQTAPTMYIPVVFFYQYKLNSNHAEISESLKKSLSQTLSHFYPLAGTLQENSIIDCDDSGVEFIEARANASLSHFTENPKTEELRRLIPIDSSSHTCGALVALKLTFFNCGGGFSVGISWSHKLGDFVSFLGFTNAWASACRGETLISLPSFDLAVRFPPKVMAIEHQGEPQEEIVTKRFVFDKETLERIRAESACKNQNPSRVEALSAFIWKMFIDAGKTKRAPEISSFAALHCINLRPRSVPPIPEETFGNCFIGKFAFASNGEISDLVSSLKAAIRSVNGDYIKNVVSDDGYLAMLDEVNGSFKNGTAELTNFSSWLGFPVYDVDFGWGKPHWMCTVTHPVKNMVLMMSNPQGDGIEAWIGVPLDISENFENLYNTLVTTNPQGLT